MKKEKGWLPSMKKEKEWIGSISESSSINRRSAGTRKRLAPFKFGSFSRGCGKNHGSGKGHPSTSEIFPSLKKFASLRTERNTKPFDASLWKIGSLPSSGKKIPGSLRGTQRKVGSPQGTQEWADPFVEGRKRNSKQPFDEANGKLLPSSGKKTPASLPRKRKRGKNRSLPPRHRASTFSLLFLPFPPHFLPKLPSGGLTNPLRKNKILPSRSSPPLAESSICTHTEIL